MVAFTILAAPFLVLWLGVLAYREEAGIALREGWRALRG
jgi:hypothetical protein